MTNKKYFISFGNERFIKSRERITKEAEQLEIFNECKYFDESVINSSYFKNITSKCKRKDAGRGYWWWLWKPYIIYNKLKDIDDGDILFYCDSGMTIFKGTSVKTKFENIFNLVSNKEQCPSGIVTFITTGNPDNRLEYMYTKGDTLKHFNVENDKNITHTQQIQAGIICCVKSELSLKIIEKWYNTGYEFPELFSGDPRFYTSIYNFPNINGFIDHRHDQSVWSILCKLNNVNVLTHDKNPIHQTHYRC